MEWSNEKSLEFLELFQTEPSLWDKAHKNHRNRGAQRDAWRRIKQGLSFPSTIDDLKKKKESLMNYYRNHLNKYKKSLQLGPNDIYTTNWFAFEVMDSFLRPVYETNNEMNSEVMVNDSSDVVSSDEWADSEVQESNHRTDSPTPSATQNEDPLGQSTKRSSRLQSTHMSTPKQRYVKKYVPEIIISERQTDSIDYISHNKRDFDEFDHFGLMMAAKIRKIKDPFNRESLMNDMQNLVFQSITRNLTSSHRQNIKPNSISIQTNCTSNDFDEKHDPE